MSWKLKNEYENSLWRHYIDNVDMMDNKWLKEVDLKIQFAQKSFSVYLEGEFLEKLKSDNEFNEKWGTIKNL